MLRQCSDKYVNITSGLKAGVINSLLIAMVSQRRNYAHREQKDRAAGSANREEM